MERDYLLSVDLTAGNIENEITWVIQDGDEYPLYTVTVECTPEVFTLICC